MDGLQPLTEYEVQMRTCYSTSGLAHTSAPSITPRQTSRKSPLCSKWSPSVTKRSPGKGELITLTQRILRTTVIICHHSCITHNLWSNLSSGPSQQLHVWRKLSNQMTNKLQMVTVLWKVRCHSLSTGLCSFMAIADVV